jgi:hypothetical protein
MGDLTAWLRAQLDDDERVAAAAHVGPWRAERAAESVYADESSVVLMPGPLDDWATYVVPPQEEGRDGIEPADAEHIACWDPARVQAEVDAKRRIIDWAEGALDVQDDHDPAQTALAAEAPYLPNCSPCRTPTGTATATSGGPEPGHRTTKRPLIPRRVRGRSAALIFP